MTDVRVKLNWNRRENVKAWCSFEFDRCFAVRDVKVIDAGDGLFLAMPCRKTTDRCPDCGEENNVVAKFCNWCGAKLAMGRARKRDNGKLDLWRDTAFPTVPDFREYLEERVLDEYERLADAAEPQPGRQNELLPPVQDGTTMQKIEGRHQE